MADRTPQCHSGQAQRDPEFMLETAQMAEHLSGYRIKSGLTVASMTIASMTIEGET